MIVCNCNYLSERDVRQAIRAGAATPLDVFLHHDAEPCCGRCIPEMDDHLSAAVTGRWMRLPEPA